MSKYGPYDYESTDGQRNITINENDCPIYVENLGNNILKATANINLLIGDQLINFDLEGEKEVEVLGPGFQSNDRYFIVSNDRMIMTTDASEETMTLYRIIKEDSEEFDGVYRLYKSTDGGESFQRDLKSNPIEVPKSQSDYKVEEDAEQIQLSIENYTISGHIVEGSIGTDEIADGSINLYKLDEEFFWELVDFGNRIQSLEDYNLDSRVSALESRIDEYSDLADGIDRVAEVIAN